MSGTKKGLLTKDEEKFFAKLIVEEINIEGLWKPLVRWTLPMLLGALDDNVGDKLPEPWQSHTEKLTTMVYESMQDKILTEAEQNEILTYTAEVINAEVDIPYLDEEQEGLTFITLLKFLASIVRKWAKESKTVKGMNN